MPMLHTQSGWNTSRQPRDSSSRNSYGSRVISPPATRSEVRFFSAA